MKRCIYKQLKNFEYDNIKNLANRYKLKNFNNIFYLY